MGDEVQDRPLSDRIDDVRMLIGGAAWEVYNEMTIADQEGRDLTGPAARLVDAALELVRGRPHVS